MAVRIHVRPENMVSDDEMELWRAIPAAVAADLSPDIGVIDPAIRPVGGIACQPRLFGRAVTAMCEPPDFGAVVQSLDFIRAGDVLVIAANGDCRNAMIGEILSGYLRKRGCAGILCDGAVRDVETLGGWSDFPVFARGIVPRGPASSEHGAINQRVTVGGCSVDPGDLIIGDGDGVVVLSPTAARTYLTAARDRLEKEAGWIKAFASGRSAKETFGLGALQQV